MTDNPRNFNHIGDLFPDKRNARKHGIRNIGMIEAALRDVGAARSIVVDEDGVILAGNATVEAATAAGIERVITVDADGETIIAVRRTGLTPEQKTKLALFDNRTAELADWDTDVLASLNDEVDLSGMFFDDELAELLAGLDPPAALGDPDAVPDPPADPTTQPGDLWLLGEHRLLCGDCRHEEDMGRIFGVNRAAVVVTSPPYANQRDYDTSSGFVPIRPDAYVEWFRDVAMRIERVLLPEGSYFLNIKSHADEGQRSLYVMDLVLAHARQWGWMFVDEFCWRNTRDGVPGGWPNRFKNAWEPVYHFTRGSSITFHPFIVGHDSTHVFDYSSDNSKSASGSGLLGVDRPASRPGTARPSNVIETPAETGQGNHSAPYPVALPEFFVKAFSNPGDIVFDPFMGSGTSLIAAVKNNRVGYGMEISPTYCDVIVRRWETFTGQQATREAVA